MADFFEGLKIVDVRDPARTQIVGSFDGDSNRQLDAWRVTLNGPCAYVLGIPATGMPGLWVVNTLGPAHPIFWDYYDVPGVGGGIMIEGNIVYLAGDGELYMLRINDHVMQAQAHLPIMSMSQN